MTDTMIGMDVAKRVFRLHGADSVPRRGARTPTFRRARSRAGRPSRQPEAGEVVPAGEGFKAHVSARDRSLVVASMIVPTVEGDRGPTGAAQAPGTMMAASFGSEYPI